ncbi:MAG: primosomal protein N' [Saccharofermentans sp.]|nr:primosomal protein N' [Saccharofermentans sp.]
MDICSVLIRGAVRQTDKPFTYLIPEELKGKILPGSFVRIPFGRANKLSSAVVIGTSDQDVDTSKTKSVDSLISELPVMNEDQLKLIDMISMRFNCTKGDAIELMVPSCVEQHKDPELTYVKIADANVAEAVLTAGSLRSQAHINILEYLLSSGDTERSMLIASLGVSPTQLKAVIDKGLVTAYKKKAEASVSDTSLVDKDSLDEKFVMTFDLNDEQKAAVRDISSDDPASVYLLFGITGSGKTEVYLNCAQECLNKGRNVLYLVPEISLTPQTINWIVGRLGERVAVLHSRLTPRQRYEQWDRIRRGVARVVVAPRSGIFAPVKDLGLIIIDEEHDSSYKSETHPRYNTKDVARMRQGLTGAKIILGSATPSVESFYAAKKNVYKLITLKERAHGEAKLPEIIPVDMKEQLKLGAGEMLSVPLRQAMARAFSQKKQVMLFLNRRGYSRTLVCGDCGTTVNCVNCSVAMTLHNNKRTGGKSLVCHYCGYTIPVSEARCTGCGGTNFTRAGFGTQQLEELLKELYPCEKILRMDQDTTMSPDAHSEIISKFAKKEASVLIGTQMIAKGLDFPDVTVVGILGADLMLMSSNYMASERAFQLITQAAGRAGRGDYPGEVYIQSYRPELPLFRYACTQDYLSFFDSEIEYREKVKLPPFKAIGELVVSSADEDDVITKSNILADYLRQFLEVQDPKYGFELYGPIPDVLYELRGKFRMDIVIKASNKSAINAVFRQVASDFDPKIYQIGVNNDASG